MYRSRHPRPSTSRSTRLLQDFWHRTECERVRFDDQDHSHPLRDIQLLEHLDKAGSSQSGSPRLHHFHARSSLHLDDGTTDRLSSGRYYHSVGSVNPHTSSYILWLCDTPSYTGRTIHSSTRFKSDRDRRTTRPYCTVCSWFDPLF